MQEIIRGQREVRRLLLLACLAYLTIGSQCASEGDDSLTDPENHPGTILGTVVFGFADAPVGGAEVTLAGPEGTRTATSGADGRFRFPDLSPGAYTLVATLPRSTDSTCESVSVNVQAERIATAIISCVVATGTLTVTLGVGQEPLQEAQVVIFGAHATRSVRIEAEGVALFEDVPTGSYLITTIRTDYDCPSASGTVVARQATSVNIDCIAQPGTIRGQVTIDGAGGAFVQVMYSKSMSTLGATLTDDTGGDYQFRQVAPGVYTVRIMPRSGATCGDTETEVNVQPGQDATVNFACTATSGEGTVTGTVMVEGSPISEARVRVIPWWETEEVFTGADGTFTFVGPAGPTTVAAFALGFDCQPVSASIQANEVVTANIPCRPATGTGGGITGRTLDLFFRGPFLGPFLDGLQVVLTGPVGSEVFAGSSSPFLFEDLPPGHYIVGSSGAFDEFCVPVPAIAVVQAGATTTVDLYCTFDF
jgi:hypothetical protein